MTTTPAPTAPPAPPSVLPLATGVWTVDPNHSGVHFRVRHLGVSNVRGRFNRFDATLHVGTSLNDTSVAASIDMTSVDTNQADRDAHLRSTDFFAAELHPELLFRSTRIHHRGGDDYQLDGVLTINGVSQPVTLDVELSGVQVHPGDGLNHAGFYATTEISRSDFGIDFNMPLGVAKLALGDKIKIELDLQFTPHS